ncbi:MAG: cell envelope integrity protein CreD [Acidobacteria bacterium]|nr:cell envelope integrity protein CreD [Acidobacteriota bacterium]
MRNSPIVRLAIMGFLLMGLLVPIAMIVVLVSERSSRRATAAEEVGAVWGGPQIVGGPVLSVPYRCPPVEASGRQVECHGRAHFLADALRIAGSIEPEVRRRGLFPVIVYRARLRISGRFAPPDFSSLRPAAHEILWNEAVLSVGVTAPRGIARPVQLRWGGRAIDFQPGAPPVGLYDTGLRAALGGVLAGRPEAPVDFELDLDVNGTRDLQFLPAGQSTDVELTSSWSHPSFSGAALPQSHDSGAAGFRATWSVPGFGRPYPGSWTHAEPAGGHLKAQASAAAFGVMLMQPVDIYHQTERAVKYAILFIVTTFVVAFLWEITARVPLHPVQYLFVGFALCVFYLLLLSISEHFGFDLAYSVSATATTLLVGWYWSWVLRGAVRGTAMGATLAALYGFLYLLLRLEDYALLAGSLGLFALLAIVMFVTRRVDWCSLSLGTPGEESR